MQLIGLYLVLLLSGCGNDTVLAYQHIKLGNPIECDCRLTSWGATPHMGRDGMRRMETSSVIVHTSTQGFITTSESQVNPGGLVACCGPLVEFLVRP